MRRGDKSEAVRLLQQALVAAGHPLPRWGCDGRLGGETFDALDALAEDLGLDGDQTPGDTVPEALRRLVFAQAALATRRLSVGESRVLDCRSSYGGPVSGQRRWDQVDTICLHQMAAKGPGGWRRWRDLAIHYAVCCDGTAAWLVDLTTRVSHGHGWNGRSVGLEIEGHYAGVEGRPETHWVPEEPSPSRKVPMVLAEGQVKAALDAIRHAVGRVAEHGGRIRYCVAHRQSYGLKTSDPGEAIWRRVALAAMREHDLTGLPPIAHPKHPGRPIPEAWGGEPGVPY